MPISPTQASSGINQLGLEQFLRILTDQLKTQDPLKPPSNQEFVAQLAQFASLEQARQTNLRLEQLTQTEGVTASVGLLNKVVDFNLTDGGVARGIVKAVDFESGTPTLTIQVGQRQEQGISLVQIVRLQPQ